MPRLSISHSARRLRGRRTTTSRSSSANDPATGLRAIIAIHSTALGPALGGTRFYPYASTGRRAADVLNLSRGMSYKAALAGLDLGGGKAVIIGDPADAARPRRCCAPTAGSCSRSAAATTPPATSAPTPRTWTTSPASAPTSPAARSRTAAPATARCSRRTACSRACAPPPSSPGARRRSPGRTVGVAGVGKVGHHLVAPPASRTAPASSSPTSTPPRSTGSASEHPGVRVVAVDRGAGRRAARRLRAVRARRRAHRRGRRGADARKIVCGAANNQLAHPGIEKALEERGILYAPDYCVNSGGLIQVADELDRPASASSAPSSGPRGIFDTTYSVFELAASRRRPAGDRRRPARRAADARRRPAARDLARLS